MLSLVVVSLSLLHLLGVLSSFVEVAAVVAVLLLLLHLAVVLYCLFSEQVVVVLLIFCVILDLLLVVWYLVCIEGCSHIECSWCVVYIGVLCSAIEGVGLICYCSILVSGIVVSWCECLVVSSASP